MTNKIYLEPQKVSWIAPFYTISIISMSIGLVYWHGEVKTNYFRKYLKSMAKTFDKDFSILFEIFYMFILLLFLSYCFLREKCYT